MENFGLRVETWGAQTSKRHQDSEKLYHYDRDSEGHISPLTHVHLERY